MIFALRTASVALIIALGIGCAPIRPVATSQRDSVRIETVTRDVVIRDTVHVAIPQIVERVTVRRDSSLLQNEFARSAAVVLGDGALFHSLETIPRQLSHPVESVVEVRDSIIYKERVMSQTIEVERQLTRWQRGQIWGFWLLLLVVGAAFYSKIRW
ncbi:MAG: hypothetical protein SNH94_00150 [Rikenellaceae bacterium]